MDTRSATSYLFIIFVFLAIGVKSDSLEKTISHLSVPTAPTGLPKKLPTIESSESKVAKSYAKLSNASDNDFSNEDDVKGAPPDHIVPHSDHENPKEPSTRSKYTDPSNQPSSLPKVELDFVPTKLYAQVRNTHTVKHLPREDAIKSATNEEEIIAAPRLREVVSKSKTNTIYTEEGYEDAAYDHAGHIRDADFHEGFARKLEDQQSVKENDIEPKSKEENEEIKSNEAAKFNDYNDDYRDHEESIIDETTIQKPVNSKEVEYMRLKSLWQDSSINPKQVTENEIEKLEQDLEAEYKESEKNAETEVPKNLENPREDDEEEETEFSREANTTTDYSSEKKVDEKIDDSGETSTKSVNSPSSIESRNNKVYDISSTNPSEFQDRSTSIDPSPDYGKIFWDYFKSVENNNQPQEFSTNKEIVTTFENPENPIVGEFTSVPSYTSSQTSLVNFDLTSNLPETEFNNVFATTKIDGKFPSIASFYESWKRRDHYGNSEESPERNAKSSDSYETRFEDSEESEKEASSDNLRSRTGPKKLTYTVITRTSEKPTTKSVPCDHEDHTRSREEDLIVKPTYKKTLNNGGDQVSPENVNDYPLTNDFSNIHPPLPVPLRQVTYADFPPDSYAGLAHSGMTREIGANEENIYNSVRDRYEPLKNPYENRGHNSHPRYNRFQGRKKRLHHRHHHPHHVFPITKLVPPSPMYQSKYSDYMGGRRVAKPRKRSDKSSNFDPWSEILNFYRSIDRTIFGRRRRSVNGEIYKEKNITPSGKVNGDSLVTSSKKFQPERNVFRESNQLVVTNDAGLEKSIGIDTRQRRSDDKLLHESPRIVDEIVDEEIESRFKDRDTEEEDDVEKENDEKHGEIEIEVPNFNFSEVITNNKSQNDIEKRPIKEDFLDIEKYPFYKNLNVPRSSVLKYITNPRTVPRKTLGGTEFYDSRDRYRKCDEVEPDLESVLPEEEQPSDDREPRGDKPRLGGLGDKLDCFRAKYFDDNPLDNPLFLEKQVGQPRIPEDFDPAIFTSRILSKSNDEEEPQVLQRISRKPETIRSNIRRRGTEKNQFTRNQNQNYQLSDNDKQSNELQKNHRDESIQRRRKTRRKRPQTTTEIPKLTPTPYQHEVYEDVMGTIKNLAGLYQTFGEPIPSSSMQPSINHAFTTPSRTNVDFPTVHITERPRGFILRPSLTPQPTVSQKFHHYRIIPYRTNKVSYRTRTRTESPLGEEGVKIGYFRTVTVHKRSVDMEEISSDLKSEETRNIRTARTNNETNKAMNINESERPATTERIVYTIRDRIRHSKPREIPGRHGKFTNLEAAASEDMRRREPRYNEIRRKKVSSSNDEQTTTAKWKEHEPVTYAKNMTSKNTTSDKYGYHNEPGEMYKIQYSTTRGRQIDPKNFERRDGNESSENDGKEELSSEEEIKKQSQRKNYDVHETEEDDVTTISSHIEPTRGTAYFELEKYLASDPPGYSEAFNDKSTELSTKFIEDQKPRKSYKSSESRREPNEHDAEEEEEEEKEDEGEDDDQDEEKQVERPSESYVDENSSLKSDEDEDSAKKLESYKNREEDEENEEEGDEEGETHSSLTDDDANSHVEDGEKEFERFASRPFSPFESYEDPKYANLGPRLSKPYFHHPSFSTTNYRKKKYSDESDESREREEEKSRYVFPWDADKADDEEDAEESKDKRHMIERHEYPWERRERLARERKKRAKQRREYEKLFGLFDDTEDEEDDEETSHTQLHQKRVYPWEQYEVPSKNSRRVKGMRRTIDNDEMSSEYQPRFSSRYKSKGFHINDDDDPIIVSGADPREIKMSVMESFKKASNNEPNKRTMLLKNMLQLNATTAVPTITATSKKTKRRNFRTHSSTTPSSTINSTEIIRNPRIWRTITSTTKKPISRRRKDGILSRESLESGSEKKEIVTNPPEKIYLGPSNSTIGVDKKIRRRRPLINPITTSTIITTTLRPFRKRLQQTTMNPMKEKTNYEESTMKSVTEKTTTPKMKMIEHRSRFSKEEIITKTSYPGFKNSHGNNETNHDNEQIDDGEKDVKPSNSQETLTKESIKKVSILTEETPDHIFRTEEINKNGVKGMFVSITPNNGTKSASDEEETRQMLKSFENSEENHEEEDPEISFMRDDHLLAHLLKQVPPYTTHLTLDDNSNEKDDFSEPEGSGTIEDDGDRNEDHIRANYEKYPHRRLYYYIEE